AIVPVGQINIGKTLDHGRYWIPLVKVPVADLIGQIAVHPLCAENRANRGGSTGARPYFTPLIVGSQYRRGSTTQHHGRSQQTDGMMDSLPVLRAGSDLHRSLLERFLVIVFGI